MARASRSYRRGVLGHLGRPSPSMGPGNDEAPQPIRAEGLGGRGEIRAAVRRARPKSNPRCPWLRVRKD